MFYQIFEKSIELKLKITPGSKLDKVLGVLGKERLKISLKTAAEKGKANKDLIRFLAKKLNINQSQIILIRGDISPEKTILINELNLDQIKTIENYFIKLGSP